MKKEKQITGFTEYFYLNLSDETGKIMAFFAGERREERFNLIKEEGVLFLTNYYHNFFLLINSKLDL
jgi:hypothetical protein